MNNTEIHETDFKYQIKEISEQSQWNDYCFNNYTFSEYVGMSISDKKADFEDYIDNESIEELLSQNYWEGIFTKEPTVVYDNVVGVLEE